MAPTTAPTMAPPRRHETERNQAPAPPKRSLRFSWIDLLLAIAGALMFAGSYAAGYIDYAFTLLVVGLPAVLLAARARRASRGELELGLVRHPLRRDLRPYVAQALNVWIFLALCAAMLVLDTLAVHRIALSGDAYLALRIAAWVGLVAMAALMLVPRRRILVATNVLIAGASIFLALQVARVTEPPRDAVTIDLPVRGEWYVVHGGRSSLLNAAHHRIDAEHDALDLVRLAGDRSYAGDRHDLSSYPAFGAPLVAPADGRITSVADGLPDLPIGEADTTHAEGNHLVMEIGGGRYLMLGHLQRGSVSVERGERVRRGQHIARVGNSGNSSEPHLHIQIQNEPTFDADRSSLRTYPILFRGVVQTRGGDERTPARADLRRGDQVRPVAG
jgi:hypothetical protein